MIINGHSNQIKSNQIYLPTQNMKEKYRKIQTKTEVKQNVKTMTN